MEGKRHTVRCTASPLTCADLRWEIFFGHHAMPGTLIPPSHVVALPHLRGPATPPWIPWSRAGLEWGQMMSLWSCGKLCDTVGSHMIIF